MSQSSYYADTAWHPNAAPPRRFNTDTRSGWFCTNWTSGEALPKRYVKDLVPAKFMETWNPEAINEDERIEKERRAREQAGGEAYNPVGWIDHESIRWATLPASSWFWLVLKGGGKTLFCVTVPAAIFVIFAFYVQVDYPTTSHFLADALNTISILCGPFLAAWTLGSLVERFLPHWVYKAPKGPLWEINRRTGMVTIFKDPKKPENAGEIEHQAPFADFDGYLQSGPTQQGHMLYYPVMTHRTREISLGLTALSAATSMPQEGRALWNCLCQYMDTTAPLPDIPLFEPCRQQDPVTAEHDKTTGRNPRYWRDMDEATYKEHAKAMARHTMEI